MSRDIPDAVDVARGRDSAHAAMETGFEREAQEWADWLQSYINQGLEMILAGRTGEVKGTKRRNNVEYVVLALPHGVVVSFLSGYGQEERVERLLRDRYGASGYKVTGSPNSERPNEYAILVALP